MSFKASINALQGKGASSNSFEDDTGGRVYQDSKMTESQRKSYDPCEPMFTSAQNRLNKVNQGMEVLGQERVKRVAIKELCPVPGTFIPHKMGDWPFQCPALSELMLPDQGDEPRRVREEEGRDVAMVPILTSQSVAKKVWNDELTLMWIPRSVKEHTSVIFGSIPWGIFETGDEAAITLWLELTNLFIENSGSTKKAYDGLYVDAEEKCAAETLKAQQEKKEAEEAAKKAEEEKQAAQDGRRQAEAEVRRVQRERDQEIEAARNLAAQEERNRAYADRQHQQAEYQRQMEQERNRLREEAAAERAKLDAERQRMQQEADEQRRTMHDSQMREMNMMREQLRRGMLGNFMGQAPATAADQARQEQEDERKRLEEEERQREQQRQEETERLRQETEAERQRMMQETEAERQRLVQEAEAERQRLTQEAAAERQRLAREAERIAIEKAELEYQQQQMQEQKEQEQQAERERQNAERLEAQRQEEIRAQEEEAIRERQVQEAQEASIQRARKMEEERQQREHQEQQQAREEQERARKEKEEVAKKEKEEAAAKRREAAKVNAAKQAEKKKQEKEAYAQQQIQQVEKALGAETALLLGRAYIVKFGAETVIRLYREEKQAKFVAAESSKRGRSTEGEPQKTVKRSPGCSPAGTPRNFVTVATSAVKTRHMRASDPPIEHEEIICDTEEDEVTKLDHTTNPIFKKLKERNNSKSEEAKSKDPLDEMRKLAGSAVKATKGFVAKLPVEKTLAGSAIRGGLLKLQSMADLLPAESADDYEDDDGNSPIASKKLFVETPSTAPPPTQASSSKSPPTTSGPEPKDMTPEERREKEDRLAAVRTQLAKMKEGLKKRDEDALQIDGDDAVVSDFDSFHDGDEEPTNFKKPRQAKAKPKPKAKNKKMDTDKENAPPKPKRVSKTGKPLGRPPNKK